MNDDLRGCQCTIIAFAMMTFIVVGILALLLLSSCTLAINVIHSQGVASDIVDETNTPTADVNANLELPVTGL